VGKHSKIKGRKRFFKLRHKKPEIITTENKSLFLKKANLFQYKLNVNAAGKDARIFYFCSILPIPFMGNFTQNGEKHPHPAPSHCYLLV